MVFISALLPADSTFLESSVSETFELDSTQSPPPLLLSPQDQSIAQVPRSPRLKLESISEQDDSPQSQILPGDLYAEPQEGLTPSEVQSPFPRLTPLPSPTFSSTAPPRSPGDARGSISSQRTNHTRSRHPTREATIFGSSKRPEHGPQRWPFARPSLNQLVTHAVETFASVSPMPEHRDVEALDGFWKTYAREARTHDQQLIAGWHKSLDVRLLFAGLFSAIIVQFIVESYKLLLDPQTQAPLPSPRFSGRSGYAVRVNVMWFGSLVVNLLTALLAIHCKQWLDSYSVDLVYPTGPSNLFRVCRLRQYRYNGLKNYHINGIIASLPILLYASVLCFGIGLLDWLWHLNMWIAFYVVVLCAPVVLFGIVTTFLPMFTTRTPFKTPMSCLFGNLWRGMWHREVKIKGPMEEEEMDDVDAEGETLDKDMFRWVMENTRDEEIYQDAVRAHREYIRCLHQHRRANSNS